MTVININNISGIASVNAQSNSLELFDNTGASLLDLNANTATFSGSISVGGTVTYDDVTNIDSVGVITARSGLQVTSGNVAIGTDNPLRRLHVQSPGSTSNALFGNSENNNSIEVTRTGSTASYFQVQTYTNICNVVGGPTLAFRTSDPIGSASTERFRVGSDGRVGIGTDDPQSILHVSSPDNTGQLRVSSGANPDGVTLTSRNDGTGSQIIARGTNSHLRFYTTNSSDSILERVRIHSDGVIQTLNHAECQAYHNSGISITGGDGSSHYLTFTDFRFNRGGYTINGSNKIVLPKTGAYRILTTIEGMIASSAYSIRAMRARPRIDGTSISSATGQSQWHSAVAGPSSNTHWTFHDQYYFTASAGGAVDIFFQWYPGGSKTETLYPAISLFYIG